MKDINWLFVFGILAAMDLGVIAFYAVHVHMGGWPSLTDLDGERNLGAWWGGGQLLLAGQALLSIPVLRVGLESRLRVFYWVSGFSFVLLSADEVLGLHENITEVNRAADLGIPMFNGSGAWIAVYAAIAVLLLLVFLRPILLILRMDRRGSAAILGGFALAIAGGVAVEVMGYYDAVFSRGSPMQVGLEESLELIGISLIVLGCWFHLRRVTADGPAR